MQLRDWVRALRLGWPLVLVLALVGLVAGALAAAAQRPVYIATAKAYVAVASATDAGDLMNAAQYTQQVASSFADIAGTSYVLRPVIERLGLDMTPAALADSVTVTAAPGETVLVIRAEDPSPSRAVRIADAVASRLSTAITSLTPTGGRVEVTVVDPAVRPSTPASPIPLLYVGWGVAAGLFLGALLAVLRALRDTRIRTSEDVRAVTSLPVLATTPRDDAVGRGAVLVRDPQGPLAESYRGLRTALQYLGVDDGARSIVVTSSVESEGKSVAAVNLAVALAEAGERVLLVDADLRRPSIDRLLGLEGAVGLTDLLIDRVPLDRAVQTGEHGLLSVLASGAVPPNPNEMLQSRALERLLPVLEQHYDRIVIDAPPVLPVTDAAILAHRTSGALLVVGAGRVDRGQLRGALEVLHRTRAPVLGIVLTLLPLRSTEAGAARAPYGRRAGADALARRAPAAPVRERGAVRRQASPQDDRQDADREEGLPAEIPVPEGNAVDDATAAGSAVIAHGPAADDAESARPPGDADDGTADHATADDEPADDEPGDDGTAGDEPSDDEPADDWTTDDERAADEQGRDEDAEDPRGRRRGHRRRAGRGRARRRRARR